jgi:hypothetical protein
MDYFQERFQICKECPHFANILKTCKLCGCFLPGKTLIKSSVCPDMPPRWLAIDSDINNSKCCNKGKE